MNPNAHSLNGFLTVLLTLVALAAPAPWADAAAGAPKSAAPDLKVFISVDMEGIAGVVTADQLGPAGFEYERFRHFMSNETLAAVRAAKEAGATEIVVSDSHG